MVMLCFLLPDLTVIFAVPRFLAVIMPFAVTVAMFLLEVVYVTFSCEVDGVTVVDIVFFVPALRVAFVKDTLIAVVFTVPL